MKGTHEVFIPLQGGGAFITGVPDKCNHDDKLTVFELSNGKQVFEDTHRCPTNEATHEYIETVYKSNIVGVTSGCSKCRKILTLKELMGDAFYDL